MREQGHAEVEVKEELGLSLRSEWVLDKNDFSTPFFAAPLHPIPSPWKFQHPFHGRLTSNMLCKRCEQQVSLFDMKAQRERCF